MRYPSDPAALRKGSPEWRRCMVEEVGLREAWLDFAASAANLPFELADREGRFDDMMHMLDVSRGGFRRTIAAAELSPTNSHRKRPLKPRARRACRFDGGRRNESGGRARAAGAAPVTILEPRPLAGRHRARIFLARHHLPRSSAGLHAPTVNVGSCLASGHAHARGCAPKWFGTAHPQDRLAPVDRPPFASSSGGR